MGKIRGDQPLVPSILDRLLDDNPAVQQETGKSRNQLLRDLKQSVRRDLEKLLNTRRRCIPHADHLTELERSLVNYGIPDFVGMTGATTEDRAKLAATLERVIRLFEPRFKSVQVHLLDNTEPMDRTLRFRIDGLLFADPAPEPVVFDSAADPATATFEIKGVSQ